MQTPWAQATRFVFQNTPGLQVRFTDQRRIAKHANFSFDTSILEVFSTLMSGAQLHVIPEKNRFSLSRLNEYFQAQGITWTLLTTQLGEQFMECMDHSSLRILCMGGEKLRIHRVRPGSGPRAVQHDPLGKELKA